MRRFGDLAGGDASLGEPCYGNHDKFD